MYVCERVCLKCSSLCGQDVGCRQHSVHAYGSTSGRCWHLTWHHVLVCVFVCVCVCVYIWMYGYLQFTYAIYTYKHIHTRIHV